MPEILQFLMARGKAVLWSSKEHLNCKDPPTFLCNGKCPNDAKKCGFNINWLTTDLEKIFLFPEQNCSEVVSDELGQSQAMDEDEQIENELVSEDKKEWQYLFGDETSEHSDEEYDEGRVDIEYYRNKVSWVVLDEIIENEELISVEEETIIRTMLALEEARTDFIYGDMKAVEVNNQTDSSTNDDIELSITNPSTDLPKTNVANNNGVATDTTDVANAVVSDSVVDLTKTSPSLSPTQSDIVNASASARDVTLNSEPAHILKGAQYYSGNTQGGSSQPAFTSADFPVSTTGLCPYCHSNNVVYIILQEDEKEELPELLEKLRKLGYATPMKKGDHVLPSFQCRNCTYGFNLDWTVTNLEKIFLENPATSYSSYQGYYANAYYPQQMYSAYPAGQYHGAAWMGYMPTDPYYGYRWEAATQPQVATTGIQPTVTGHSILPASTNANITLTDVKLTSDIADNLPVSEGDNTTTSDQKADIATEGGSNVKVPPPTNDSETIIIEEESDVENDSNVVTEEGSNLQITSPTNKPETIEVDSESDMELESDNNVEEKASQYKNLQEKEGSTIEDLNAQNSTLQNTTLESVQDISTETKVDKKVVDKSNTESDTNGVSIIDICEAANVSPEILEKDTLTVEEDEKMDTLIAGEKEKMNTLRGEIDEISDTLKDGENKKTDSPTAEENEKMDTLPSEEDEKIDTLTSGENEKADSVTAEVDERMGTPTGIEKMVKVNGEPDNKLRNKQELENQTSTDDANSNTRRTRNSRKRNIKKEANPLKVIAEECDTSPLCVKKPCIEETILSNDNKLDDVGSPFTESLVNLLTDTNEISTKADDMSTADDSDKSVVTESNKLNFALNRYVESMSTDSMSPKSDLFDLNLEGLVSMEKTDVTIEGQNDQQEGSNKTITTEKESDETNSTTKAVQKNARRGGRGKRARGRGRGRGRKKAK
ncbi:uncharacterized protein LOC130657924 isoform X2 [Hydractinia symbiolongicarpus]|nr:uncharacterized protein LOC130657924 isoform X2 [Hydractinia symbiolongicarpus]